MKAAMAALGADPDRLEIPILQFVHLVEGGERVSMSKRRGDFITLDDLLDEIGVDATRFFMLQRSHDSTIDLDLDLAREQSAENPVYYVQYAHARIVSVLRKAGDERVAEALRRLRRRAAARPGRARADQEAARVPGRGRRGGRAPGAAPDRRLRTRARADVHRVLPRLPGRRCRAEAPRVLPDRPVRRDAADPGPLARPARRLGARLDVDRARDRRAVALQTGAERARDRERGVVGRQHVEHEARDAAARGVRLRARGSAGGRGPCPGARRRP